MNSPSKKQPLPLDEVMLAMDVVDTLRHQSDLVERELNGEAKKDLLIDRLRDIYSAQGIDVPDYILAEGVDALSKDRFIYTPPAKSFATSLAKIYISRSKWGKWLIGSILALVLGTSYYQFSHLPNQQANLENAKIEISQTLPNQMQAVYDSIFSETKVQIALTQADEILQKGLIASKEENLARAKSALKSLTDLRDLLRLEYQLRIVNKEGEKSGFWTFPEVNTDATNYYLVVEALDSENRPITLPILNEETGQIENVNIWGIRVSKDIYESVGADKLDDGIIQRNIIGNKSYGYLKVTYSVPVLDGAVTRW